MQRKWEKLGWCIYKLGRIYLYRLDMSSLLVKAYWKYNNKNNNKLYYSDVYKLPLGLMLKEPPQKL